jgi:hypothetical protein
VHSRGHWCKNAFCIFSPGEYEGQRDVMSTRYAMLASLQTVLLCSPDHRASSSLPLARWSKMSASRQPIIVPFYKILYIMDL